MISEKKVCDLILESLQQVKAGDVVYKTWALNESTIVLGNQSQMDSVAFTAFVISLEEKIETTIGTSYELNLEKIYGKDDPENTNLSAIQLARRITENLS